MFCTQILEIDPKIRLAAVYDKWAARVGGGMRQNFDDLLPENIENEFANQNILSWQARKNMSKWLGKTKYSLTEYEKVKRFSFYLGDDNLLLVSTEKDADTNVVVNEIIKLFKKIKISSNL